MRLKLGALALISLLIWLAGTAWQWGIADIYATQAKVHIKSWRKRGKSPNEQEWRKAEDNLVRALEYNPGFPPYLEALGELTLSRSLDFFLDDAEAGKLRQTALGYFREEVAKRPTWPFGWANILLVKLANEESGEELAYSLRQAASLGGWDSKIQRIVTRAGFSGWSELDQSAKEAVLRVFEQAMKRQPGQTLKIAGEQDALGIVCPLLANEQKSEYCQHH